jgi:hypothetical protein
MSRPCVLLVATAEQYDDLRTTASEIDTVSGAIVDPQLRNARSNGRDVAGVAQREALKPHVDPGDAGAGGTRVDCYELHNI